MKLNTYIMQTMERSVIGVFNRTREHRLDSSGLASPGNMDTEEVVRLHALAFEALVTARDLMNRREGQMLPLDTYTLRESTDIALLTLRRGLEDVGQENLVSGILYNANKRRLGVNPDPIIA